MAIDELADLIRTILNCSSTNQTKSQVAQKRYGINHGGDYYLFEVVGLEIKIIQNAGETSEDKYSAYEYYLMCNELESLNEKLSGSVVLYISELLKNNNLENVVVEI